MFVPVVVSPSGIGGAPGRVTPSKLTFTVLV
jgi:hypothetical protein